MMKRSIVFIFFVCLVAFTTGDPFPELYKLAGTWKMKTSKGEIVERWQVIDSNLLTGLGYFIGRDTALLEQVELKRTPKGIFYIPLVEGQNNSIPVIFELKQSPPNTFIFENPTHDFPQRIIYRFVTADSVVARIEGEEHGSEKFVEYYYKKQK